MQETSKAIIRRLQDARYVNTYFRGIGIDIGAGDDSLEKYFQQFPLMSEVRAWDLPDGDAQKMENVEDNTFDFVHSSHCLEHMRDPYEAFTNWIRICKPGGHIVITIPDEDLYEQGVWPSNFNGDHKITWTIAKQKSWSPVSINVVEFLHNYAINIEILKIELINSAFMYNVARIDQTSSSISECAIEFIVRKRLQQEIIVGGRLPQ